MTNNTSNTNNTNKWDKLLGILLCLGVFIGLIYLSNSNRQKAEEFSKAVDQNNISEISQSTNSASVELKNNKETNVATLDNFKNHVAPVLKWNLDKQWEWKPFRAGKEVELKESKYISKHEYALLRKVIAKQIFITVESHLLPDPRSSEEALNDFFKFWRHHEAIAGLTKMQLKYMASFNPKFSEQEMQVMEEARKFFSDKRKMEETRQKIKEAKSMNDFFDADDREALVSQFLRHLMQIKKIVYSNH